MQRASVQLGWRVVAFMLFATLSVCSSGCLLATAGAVGGAVGYAYCKGKHCQSYAADFTDTCAAVQAALGDFAMPVVKAEIQGHKGTIESRTADGDKVKIHLDTLPSPIPADGTVTRVCIRVATFGDQFVSRRFFDQVSAHLVPPGVVLQSPPAVAPAVAEPPLAGQER